jgi:hypothetical protein
MLQRQELRDEIRSKLKKEELTPSSSRASIAALQFRGGGRMQGSYAESVAMIGQLVGKRSPRTLRAMLREARHGTLAVPIPAASQAGNLAKRKVPSALSVRQVRR